MKDGSTLVKSGAAEGNEILQRVLLTIDSMEVELKAEGEHFSANAESDALYSVDDAWGANLIGASRPRAVQRASKRR